MNCEYEQRIEKIEREIRKCLPTKVSQKWVEKSIGPLPHPLDNKYYDTINKPALDLIDRGGKRWRPFLMHLCCELYNGKDKSLSLAPLVELPHNGSLIIDDIEDGADMRRGKKAVHILYGMDMAINSGNMLYFLPMHLIEESGLGIDIQLALYKSITEDMRRLHFGQGLDIQWHNEHEKYPTVNEYMDMCLLKTGSLARMAARIGVIAAGASQQEANIMGSICEDLGIAFQILDDVKNLTTGNPGKLRGDDIIEGKKSLPVILCVENNPETKQELGCLFAKARQTRARDIIEKAVQILETSGSIKKAREYALGLITKARGVIQERFPPSVAGRLFIDMLDMFLK